MAALTCHPEIRLKARAVAIAHDSASQPFRLGGASSFFAGLAWVSHAPLLHYRSGWCHCRTTGWAHISGVLAGTEGTILPHVASSPASSPGLILLDGQGMCAKTSPSHGLELVQYGFLHIPLTKASHRASLESWMENRLHLLRGAAGPHNRGCRYRRENHGSHFCKCWTPPTHWIVEVPCNPRWFSKELDWSKPDVSPQAEIKPKHPDKHHLAGAMVCILAPMPCQFWGILNIFFPSDPLWLEDSHMHENFPPHTVWRRIWSLYAWIFSDRECNYGSWDLYFLFLGQNLFFFLI